MLKHKETTMYIAMMTHAEQEQVVRILRGQQWQRGTHGCLWDRGSADSYYGRAPDPHYGGVGGGSGPTVRVTDAASVAEYMAGYEDNEQLGNKKNYD
jgi:hypothetical protein